MNTPEKIADEIVSEVQLIDNTSDDAIREGRELRASIAAAIRDARLAGARAALAWASRQVDAQKERWQSANVACALTDVIGIVGFAAPAAVLDAADEQKEAA